MNKYKARLKDINSLEFAENKAKSRLSLIRRSMVRSQNRLHSLLSSPCPQSNPPWSSPAYSSLPNPSQPPTPSPPGQRPSALWRLLEWHHSTRRWERSVETWSLQLRHSRSMFPPSFELVWSWVESSLSLTSSTSPHGRPGPSFFVLGCIIWTQNELPEGSPCSCRAFLGASNPSHWASMLARGQWAADTLCLACWAAGEGRTQHSVVVPSLGAKLCFSRNILTLLGMKSKQGLPEVMVLQSCPAHPS